MREAVSGVDKHFTTIAILTDELSLETCPGNGTSSKVLGRDGGVLATGSGMLVSSSSL
jgi:hypothetical protein